MNDKGLSYIDLFAEAGGLSEGFITAPLWHKITGTAGSYQPAFSIGERPDSVFHPAFKNFFTFVIPAFMISAVPTRIALGIASPLDVLALCLSPFLLGGLYLLISITGNRKNQVSGY